MRAAGLLMTLTLLAVTSCSDGILRKCTTDADCIGAAFCHRHGFCVLIVDGGLAGGTTAGGSSGGGLAGGAGGASAGGSVAAGGGNGTAGGASGGASGGAGGGPAGGSVMACSPVCSSATECVGAACVPRYAAVEWASPGAGQTLYDATATLIAELRLAAGRTPNDPPALPFVLTRPDAGMSQALLVRTDAGVYSAQVSTPVPGLYLATVSFPDAGLGPVPVAFTTDLSPPTFTVLAEAAPARRVVGDLNELDPSAPAGAWRRDETVRLRLTSTNPAVDPSSVQVFIRGIVADGGLALVPLPEAPGQCPPAAPCMAQPYCRCLTVDLAAPPMETTSGSFKFEVRGRTPASVPSLQSSDSDPTNLPALFVTRHKWRRALRFADGGTQGTVYGSALDSRGNVIAVVGNAESLQQISLHRVQPNGDLIASRSTPEFQLIAFPMAEPLIDQEDTHWVWDPGATLTGLRIDGGTERIACDAGPGQVLVGYSPLALATTQSVPPEQNIYGVVRGPMSNFQWIMAAQPRLGTCTLRQFALSEPPKAVAASGAVFWAGTYYPSDALEQYEFVSPLTGILKNAPIIPLVPDVQLATIPGGLMLATSMLNFQVVKASQSAVTWGAGTPTWLPTGIVIASDGTTLVTARTGTNSYQLGAVTPMGSVTQLSTTLQFASPPVIGGSGVVYRVAGSIAQPALMVHHTTGAPAWQGPIGGIDPVFAPPLLDCSRSTGGTKLAGRPGVLYVMSGPLQQPVTPVPHAPVSLTSLIVDSAGVDTSALWPVFMHDPRRTNNSSTSLAQFSCP